MRIWLLKNEITYSLACIPQYHGYIGVAAKPKLTHIFTIRLFSGLSSYVHLLAAQDVEASVCYELVDDKCEEPDSIKRTLVA